ncbi:hypothetical protein [Fluviispira vulneris]|uniref:hypothetical protein n=1 Tax=Fluviispira vulneris TaxID=2763012 RepID=UPI0016464836|nr:hypothetical protein [Fluviispira vulneris]
MSIIFKFLLILLFFPWKAYGQSVIFSNPVGENLPEYKLISVNKSIMNCGDRSDLYIYSSLDIKAILSIANFLSDEKVAMTTDWNTFLPMTYNPTSSGLNERDIGNFPEDIRRILYICTTWNESFQLKLFSIPKEAIENITKSVKTNRPWQSLSQEEAYQLDHFSEATLYDFVYIILRSNVYKSIKGGFEKNPTLWSTPFTWRVINTKEKDINSELEKKD